MTPTAETRFYQRTIKNPIDGSLSPVGLPILQAKWVTHHIPAGMTSAPFEWRDVPIVLEGEE